MPLYYTPPHPKLWARLSFFRELDRCHVCVQVKKINDIPTSMKGAVIACCLVSPIMVAAIMCYEKYVKKNI